MLIFLTSAYFIFHVVDNNFSQFSKLNIGVSFSLISALGFCFFLYLILLLLLGISWVYILQTEDKINCLNIYLKSQALKYLPGNFFHFVYRHTETVKTGITHNKLIKATVTETSGLILLAS